MDEEEFNRGIILPQLLTQLKKILDQYPDDTQIFKELVQNAEDARASEVKFLYDRSSHGRDTDQLFSPGFEKFQGPALYAFNDGVFTEEDWKGLRMMCESVKQGDPFKVGYFGMGFKSVFHFTDLPSVISGNKLAYIDPQKQFFDASSRAWNLSKHQELLTDHRHQIDPYLRIFSCTEDTFKRGHYQGTLFRFPLRLKPSQLSSQPYSHDKVMALIENFRSEAHLLPLFLRHVESIEIYQRDSTDSEPRLLFQVKISPQCLKEVRQSRQDFLSKTQKTLDLLSKPIVSTHRITIETRDFESSNSADQHNFLVCNFFCGNQLSASFINLLRDSDLNYLPWVGAAMPLRETDSEGVVQDERLFCFLPLNLEEGYSSGLTVHLNGFFALEQNRKHIKWPGIYANRSREDLMDKRVRWNVCLMKEALPKCYFHLLREAIRLNSLRPDDPQTRASVHHGNVFITEKMIYRAYPNFETIDRRWESLLVPLYTELLRQPCIKTSNGQWVEPQNVVFHTLDTESDLSKIILEILSENSVRVACVPPHVFRAVKRCCRINVSEISPSLVANSCRSLQRTMKFSVLGKLNPVQKLELLRYFVTYNKFDALDGLDLLPLEDGTFHTFHYNPRKADKPIYISGDQNFVRLLPGAEKDILLTSLDEEITKLLLKASSKGMTQLKPLDSDAVAILIPKCFPTQLRNTFGKSIYPVEWKPGSPGHPGESWLESIWNFLIKHSPRDLSAVERLPLLPEKTYVNDSGEKTVELFPLASTERVRILKRHDEMHLEADVEKLLRVLGVVVLEELLDCIRLHPLVLKNFIFLPNYLGILKSIDRLCQFSDAVSVLNSIRCNATDEDKRHLRELFAKISPYEIHDDLRSLLELLPIFETVSTSNGSISSAVRFVSFRECRVAAPFGRIEFPLSSLLLDISDVSSQSLGKLLGIQQLNMVQLLIKIVFRDIEEAYYDPEQIKEVMLQVLKLYHRFSGPDSEALKNALHLLPFIERNDLYVRVSHFFSPENELVKKLFEYEKRFPDKEYLDPLVLPALKEIGLRSLENIEAEDIRESAETVEHLYNAMESGENTFQELTLSALVEKSTAILEILNKFPEKLTEECSSGITLGMALRSLRWSVYEQHKPPLYPKALMWYGNQEELVNVNKETCGRFVKPISMTSLRYAFLAGSVMPISPSNFSSDVEHALGWDEPPCPNVLLQHLTNVITSYSNQEKMAYSEMVKCIYAELAQHPSSEVKEAIEIHRVPKEWIWTGEGFASEDRVVFNQPFMDLRPFVYSIPTEMNPFVEFLEKTANLKKTCKLVDVLRVIREKHERINEAGAKNGISLADVRKDLHLCVCILNELKSLVQGCETEERRTNLLEDFSCNLYLPVLNESSNSLRLAPLRDCTYCDEEWLRQGYNISDFGINDDEDSVSISLVHPNVPASTSEVLGVPTLMSRMLDAEELDISFGQSDSFTHRLNTLILEYADGFAIPKELVQNADDAGASEVSFLYDERENEEARTCLLDEGMKECQGPALWVHNDGVFEDSDFENITKLNGATKLRQPDKIGRFGLGFNAVYNVTDIPSFVSRHSIVIFDPHTSHLGKSIKDKRKPGIRIDLRRHKKNLKRFGNQFKPYNDIFGCNLVPGSQMDSYQGTLFRLPLRTRNQAARSEISSKHYDDKEVKDLLRMVISSCESLLLFSQHVRKINIFHLPKKGNPLTNTVQIFSMEKHLIKVLKSLPFCSTPEENYCSLKAASDVLRKIRRGSNVEAANSIESSLIIRIDGKCSEVSKLDKFVDDKLHKEANASNFWLLCTGMGVAESLRMAVQDDSLVPCVTVAARIHCSADNSFVPVRLVSGSIFSFMPLPIRSGLPVHVNGAFAITSNRKFLCSKSEDDKFDLRPVWNESLLDDAACLAYTKALECLGDVCNETTEFHSLWPDPTAADPCCRALLGAFYRRLTSRDGSVALFSDGKSWAPFSRTMFLEFGFADSEIGKTAYEVFNDLSSSLFNNNFIVAFLPSWLEIAFVELPNQSHLYKNSFDIVRFFDEIFIPNVSVISPSKRDKLLLYALSLENEFLNELMATHACIPVSPDGSLMKPAKELIDPTSPAAKMFVDRDERFPLAGSSYVDPGNLRLLRSIGMKHDVAHFSWIDLLERAKVISDVDCSEAVMRQMVVTVLDAIGKLLEAEVGRLPPVRDEFRSVPFLPAMKRPQSFPLPWRDDFNGTLFMPSEIYSTEVFELVSCVRPVIDVGVFPPTPRLETVKNFLLLNSCDDQEPTVDVVLEQLDAIVSNFIPSEGVKTKSFDAVQGMCLKIYEFFQHKIGRLDPRPKQELIDALKNKPFIITTESFLSPDKVSFNFHHPLCSPYLFGAPDNLRRNFYDLLKSVGVRDQFDVYDYVRVLQEIQRNFCDSALDKLTLRKVLHFVSSVGECMTEQKLQLEEVVNSVGLIYVPDSQGFMKPAGELCYNEPDCKWLPSNDSSSFSHPLIPFTVSKQLGVNTNRLEVLKKHSKGMAFGQREKLTSRIRRILAGYPCDKEILKELLQNADDAGAREISFIKDYRHHGTSKIFDKSWKPLQGPALCVYNDVAFSEEDLEAIQRLGEGSKKHDPNKTGQYGVGFNCVYHLTDAPSFLTCGPNTPETLCVFDPHARFIPESTIQEPGRRFQSVDQLRGIFTDVFDCYLGDKFDLGNGTMFRLPLRSQEMARSSEISERAVTPEDVSELFQKFASELGECMMFLNSVRRVTLCEVEKHTGKLVTIHRVTTQISDPDSADLQQFVGKVYNKAVHIRSGNLQGLNQFDTSYRLNISDSSGSSEKWLIAKSFGFDKSVSLPPKVVEAFQNKELMLLPLGGVAALLESSGRNGKKRANRLFCLLPLPVKSEFPVHVNGHFAIDHEARRNIWYDEAENDSKTEWNKLLFQNVVSRSYVKLFQVLTSFVARKPEEPSSNGTSSALNLAFYNNLFPIPKDDSAFYWKACGMNVYRIIAHDKLKVLPMFVNRTETKVEDGRQIKWVSLSGSEGLKPVFDDLDSLYFDVRENKAGNKSTSAANLVSDKDGTETLREVLISLRYPLLAVPSKLLECFKMSGVEVQCVSPSSVVRYFHLCSPSYAKCNLDKLPRPLAATSIASTDRLKILLRYCSTDESCFHDNLEGLPLLLTADECLRTFSSKHPVYCSMFSDIFSSLGQKFVHPCLFAEMSTIQKEAHTGTFIELNMRAFSELLPLISSEKVYCNSSILSGKLVETGPFSAGLLSRIWSFIREICENVNKSEVEKKLKPIENWCLLPIKFGWPSSKEVGSQPVRGLLSVKHLKVVIDYSKNSLVGPAFRECLKKINVPGLDYEALQIRANRSSDKNESNFTFVRQIISSIDDPPSLLLAISHAMNAYRVPLSPSESSAILKYFASSLESWRNDQDSIRLLRSLCLHVTTDENMASLTDCDVIILNEQIPKFDLQAWKRNFGILFLRWDPLLSDMYLALNCRIVSASKVYTDLLLPNMKLIDQGCWLHHVQFLKDKILKDDNSQLNRSFILENLRHLEFISRDESNRKFARASEFFDPRNVVFKTHFSGHPEMFPPAPLNEFKWMDFLRQVGLQFSTTKELCIKFAREIESEARRGANDLTHDKSKVLMGDILSPSNLSDKEFLEAISTIKFIPSAKGKSYMNINIGSGKSFQSRKFISFQEGILEKHEELVWTSSYLLPNWANPFKVLTSGAQINGHSSGQHEELQELKAKISLALKIEEDPPLELVIAHLKNLCDKRPVVALSSEDQEFTNFVRSNSVKKVYRFLQLKLSEQNDEDSRKVLDLISQLSDFPCVVTNMGKTFVLPRQVVVDLREEDQIQPYLLKLPTELGELEQLFLTLGVSKKVQDVHYANVLNSLQKSVAKKRLHPNELLLAFKAISGLFSILQQTKSHSDHLQTLDCLYLPTSTGCLAKSSDLIYIDEPSWTERIKRLNCPFLVNLTECGLQTKHHLEVIKLLPHHLRPRMLSSVVSEVLEYSTCSSPSVSSVAEKLKYQMNSRAFSFGLARLIKHEHRKSSHKISNEVIESVQRQFSSLQISGIDRVQTFLLCSGKKIPESENTTCTFVEKTTGPDEDVMWKIFIDRSLKLDDELQVSISEIVNKITGGLLKNSIHYIQPILSCPPHAISKVLDRLKVRPDRQNNADVITSVLPVAGSLIPVEDHHLLTEDLEEFDPGEYVGYELDDELSGEATIVYAIVCHRSQARTDPANGNSLHVNGSPGTHGMNTSTRLTSRYVISVGDERELREVSAADLYKFQRIENMFSASDSFDSPRTSTSRCNSPVPSGVSSPKPQRRSNLCPSPLGKIRLESSRKNLFRSSISELDDNVFRDSKVLQNGCKSPIPPKKSSEMSPHTGAKSVFEIPVITVEPDSNLKEVKKEVFGVLQEAWKMSEAQRKKVVKRLLLKWHPDKNLDKVYFATEVTQFINSTIETLEFSLPHPKTFEEFRSDVNPDPRNPFAGEKSFQENFYKAYKRFSEHLSKRAKEQREQRERYKENFAREFFPHRGAQYFNFHVPPTFASTNPQPAQAKRFLRQAHEDLNAIRNDLDAPNPAFEWACFKAHQAAEKSLKAAQFFVDASNSLSHDLVVLAASLEDLELRSLAQRLQNVVGSSNKLYNPDPIDFVVIPHEEYSREMAEQSLVLAKKIFERVLELIEIKE